MKKNEYKHSNCTEQAKNKDAFSGTKKCQYQVDEMLFELEFWTKRPQLALPLRQTNFQARIFDLSRMLTIIEIEKHY